MAQGPTAHPAQPGLQAETGNLFNIPGCSSQSKGHRKPVYTILICRYGTDTYINQAVQDVCV